MFRLSIKVVPGASRDGVTQWLGDSLKLRVRAPAERGKANASVRKVLAGALDVSAKHVKVVSGHTSPQKIVEIDGVSESEARRRLGVLLGSQLE